MYFNPIWAKKICLFLALALIYALLPATIQQVVGCFATGWMLVDLADKIFN